MKAETAVLIIHTHTRTKDSEDIIIFAVQEREVARFTLYLPATKPALLYKGQTRIRRKTDGGQI